MSLLDDDGLLDIGGRRRPARDQDEELRAVLSKDRTETPIRGSAGPDAKNTARVDDPEAPARDAASGAGPGGSAIGHADPCHLCKRPASRTCTSCERRVCAADSWVMFGLCRGCATEDRVKRWNARREATGGNWLEDP